ncbi:MAG TPA: zinc ABC transporter substrate-binding protein [Chthoniobacterales bacterium]|jgi:ABC-type Zn uptake system ZnuABC Zn-binding protein ZnuA|nr:zinc ABC transporter substrate-binding protein [Chthoniobacterales bacterium]
MKKLLLPFALLLATFGPASAADRLKVASFSTVLTEIAEKVGGDHVHVFGLVRPGVDPHEYEPTPSDLKEVGQAQLILTAGKNLENYLNKLQEATGGKADLLKVGDHLPDLTMKSEDGRGTVVDPHWWHSVPNVEQATRIVRDELIKLDPADKADFDKNAQDYLRPLDDLNRWIKRKVAELPRDNRKLVTSHDAFQYFAREYGFNISAIEGVSTETEPSNRHVANLIDQIKKEHVKAIFTESTLNPKVTREITRETGAKIGGELYADGLGTGDASTYEGMMKHNVTTIVDALK